MRCEDVVDALRATPNPGSGAAQGARRHVESCEDCRLALRAVDTLRRLHTERLPMPGANAFERTIHEIVREAPAIRYRAGLKRGAVLGALAAGGAAAALGVFLHQYDSRPAVVPEVRLSLNEPRAVTVALETQEPLAGAELHVVLSGAIALQGYETQRELRWATDLERGMNSLQLPIVLSSDRGGQLVVEVLHGDKRRTFVIDVRAEAPSRDSDRAPG